ncbi:MAG: CBS domain-containing protein [Magnetococcales bacterium]|nr:CBS domain-containing protein [Magnetococcales bacterium]MBF0114089.1 CBS domain-containing protein [Magnetococcales bacterium]
MRCKITQIIERNVVTIDQHRTVSESVGIMADRGVGSIVVTGKGRVVGYFTERDLLTRVVGRKRNPETTLMQDVMSTELIKANHDASCRYCLEQMREHGIRHLLVYRDNLFIGVISLRVLAEAMTHGHGRKDWMVNIVGGMVFLVILAVIGLLAYVAPEMVAIAKRLSP